MGIKMGTAIELMDIRHRFAGKVSGGLEENEVLRGINLKVYSGEIFGLLGPSGAGKTTLIKIMTGRLKPSGGRVFLNGKEPGVSAKRAPYARAGRESGKRIGMMMDDFGLYDRLSCVDNLVLFADIYGVGKKRVDEVLEGVGLKDAKKRPAADLSKGMKIRLCFARAIMAAPELLFLDEPVTGLDPRTAAEIHRLIRKEKERGTTVFLTTHNMEEAAKLCDHVALLNEGNIVEYGEPEEICRRYNHQHKIRIRFYNGECEELGSGAGEADRIAEYFRRGLVETIHSTEPDLETVFMELTGRRVL